MAKVFKISAYVVDANDEFSTNDRLEDCLVYCTQNDINLGHIKIESADIGEWYDDHPLNFYNCPVAEYEKYFKKDKLTLVDSNKMLWVGKENFRCSCGGNVFSEYKDSDGKRIFERHSCKSKYEGE